MRTLAPIAIAGTLPLLALPFAAVPEAGNYRYAFAFLVPILWGMYAARERLHLHPLHFALFACALVLHNLGALGCYTREYFGLAFDTYVHFFFGLVGGLILQRAFRLGMGLSSWHVWVATIVFVLGLGAIHELVEFGSTLALGPKVGMYKVGNADEFDTQKDLFNNLIGSATALILASLVPRGESRRSS
jgi:uncharacterized membrane protein YjdF